MSKICLVFITVVIFVYKKLENALMNQNVKLSNILMGDREINIT